LAAGGAAVALIGRGPSSRAATLRLLPATANSSVSGGVRRFRSRPDLLAPEVVIDRAPQSVQEGLIVTESHGGPPQSGPLILDPSGRIVWFSPMGADPSSALKAFNVSVQRYHGQPVLCWFEGDVIGYPGGVGFGRGSYRIVGSNYEQIAQVSGHQGLYGDLHEFFLTPRGTALFTCYGRAQGRVRIGGRVRSVPYLFGVVQEVDVATGKLVWYWRSDRHIMLSESYRTPVLKPGWIWDYMHMNSISVDPDDDNVVISGRNTSACYKVDRRTGKVIWRLGGKHSDFAMGPGTRFNFQHHVNNHPDGVLSVFDNEGGPPQVAAQSRALILSVDQRRMRVRLEHAYRHHPPVYSDALGSVQPLTGGDWLVGWGRGTAFTRYSSEGDVLFDGHLNPASSSYRAFLQPWSGTPTAPPDIAVTLAGSGATVYASWNGATAMTQWMVLGGLDPSSLRPLGIAPVAGFETAISVASAPARLAVAACDANGAVLATSRVVAAT
jgi:hypothetical protein